MFTFKIELQEKLDKNNTTLLTSISLQFSQFKIFVIKYGKENVTKWKNTATIRQ